MKNRGVSLITLIITIVVLAILATVGINLVFNGNIIGKTEKAKDLHEIAEFKEIVGNDAIGVIQGFEEQGIPINHVTDVNFIQGMRDLGYIVVVNAKSGIDVKMKEKTVEINAEWQVITK